MSLYRIVVVLTKMWIQPASVYQIFSRLNVSFREESLEKIHFEEAEEGK